MLSPEQLARQQIDTLLEHAGWVSRTGMALNLGAARGVAVREFATDAGPADYLLFVDRKAVGVVEAKKAGTTLTGVETQSAKYRTGLPPHLPAARDPPAFCL